VVIDEIRKLMTDLETKLAEARKIRDAEVALKQHARTAAKQEEKQFHARGVSFADRGAQEQADILAMGGGNIIEETDNSALMKGYPVDVNAENKGRLSPEKLAELNAEKKKTRRKKVIKGSYGGKKKDEKE
jgi:hypothetical protein